MSEREAEYACVRIGTAVGAATTSQKCNGEWCEAKWQWTGIACANNNIFRSLYRDSPHILLRMPMRWRINVRPDPEQPKHVLRKVYDSIYGQQRTLFIILSFSRISWCAPHTASVCPPSTGPMCGVCVCVLCNEPKQTKLMWINPSESGIPAKFIAIRMHDTPHIIIFISLSEWNTIGQRSPGMRASRARINGKSSHLHKCIFRSKWNWIMCRETACVHSASDWLSLGCGRWSRHNLVRFRCQTTDSLGFLHFAKKKTK